MSGDWEEAADDAEHDHGAHTGPGRRDMRAMNAQEIAELTEVIRAAKQRLADDKWAAMSTLHQFLAQLIRDSGVAQKELAERVGFTEKHVSPDDAWTIGVDRRLGPSAGCGRGRPEQCISAHLAEHW